MSSLSETTLTQIAPLTMTQIPWMRTADVVLLSRLSRSLPARCFGIVLALAVGACDSSSPQPASTPGPGALSTALQPQQSPDYYVAQANTYFDTLDTGADPNEVPDYSTLTARWEWPPWLKLTGYGQTNMIDTTRMALAVTPSTVPVRNCKAFSMEPFARCHVQIQYSQGLCPIYEEFTFNDQGEVTFVEAWSDLPGMRPMADDDDWAQSQSVYRLSTRIPGLGNSTGTIDLQSSYMQQAAGTDANVADFVTRAGNFWPYWIQAYLQAGSDFFAKGCGWQTSTTTP